MKIITLLRLLAISLLAKIGATIKKLPGNHIDTWIRLWSMRYFTDLGIARAFQLFVHPISSIRYFEFDFILRNISTISNLRVLDVSSPREFAFYYCKKMQPDSYTMINPDSMDVGETKIQADAFNVTNFSVVTGNALSLLYKNKSFDRVISISVIEHIEKDGDSKAIKEMWRVLKPGGKLILTTHIAQHKRVEHRGHDQYNLSNIKRKKYFFQRVYDEESFKKRILSQVPVQSLAIQIWGEKEKGWFDAYIDRWIKRGLEETVWDPWHMSTRFKSYDSAEQLPGIGVVGCAFKKPL